MNPQNDVSGNCWLRRWRRGRWGTSLALRRDWYWLRGWGAGLRPQKPASSKEQDPYDPCSNLFPGTAPCGAGGRDQCSAALWTDAVGSIWNSNQFSSVRSIAITDVWTS